MTLDTELVTQGSIDGRHGYHINSDRTDKKVLSGLNLDVWADRYNIEWRTPADLQQIVEVIEDFDWIEDDTRFMGYPGEELPFQEVKSTYGEIKDNTYILDLFGNVRLKEDENFVLYWEETQEPYTMELTLYDQDSTKFENVYDQTALNAAPETGEAVEEIQVLLNDFGED